ncbi:MAG: amino acid transporter [Deltaproteobacteria bacterium CG07_land_8_20_14_0_80_38_7]|nr:MAG: amino acid transporter [Deltaproteobacteria bacterium CG07_land_8_20_14_0_80_38_7]
MGDITLYIKVFITLLMLVNPLEGMPVFLSATSSADPQLRRRILKITSISVVAILLLSIILGKLILQLFGISTEAFQIGGGAILFLIAVKMTLGPSGFSMEDITGKQIGPEFAIVPLATPLLAGPGAINGAILFGTRAHNAFEITLLMSIVVFIGIILYIILRAGHTIASYIGKTGIDVATRITGLLIAAIAAEMILKGISSVFNLKII